MLPGMSPKLPPPLDLKTPRKFEMLPRYFNFFILRIRHEEFPFLSSPRKYKLGELIIISPDFTRTGHFVEEQRRGAWVPIAMSVWKTCGYLCSICEVLRGLCVQLWGSFSGVSSVCGVTRCLRSGGGGV